MDEGNERERGDSINQHLIKFVLNSFNQYLFSSSILHTYKF